MSDRDIFTIIREDVLRWLLQRLDESREIGGWKHLENWMQVELWSRLENTLPEEYSVLNMNPPKIITGKSGREKWPNMLIFSEGQRQFFWWEIKYLGKEKSVARNIRSFMNDFRGLIAMDVGETCNDIYTKQRAKDKREILIKKFDNTEFRNAFLRSDHYAVGLVALN